jgi:hypothetical protein
LLLLLKLLKLLEVVEEDRRCHLLFELTRMRL